MRGKESLGLPGKHWVPWAGDKVTKCDKSYHWLQGGGCLASGRGRSAVFKLGDSHEERGLLCGVRGPEERRGGDTDTVIMTKKFFFFLITRATEKGGTQAVSGVVRSCHWQSSHGP